MKTLAIFPLVFLLTISLLYQQDQYEVVVRNVEVPVRVFSGDTFIDDLTRDDFEVLEDGVPQEILAMYMINKADIVKREETRNFMPFTPRIFYLAFNMTDYDPKIGDAVDYFFKEVLQPQDSLTVITPEKPYVLSSKALESRPREELTKELKKLIRKDVKKASSMYRSAISSLKRVATSISTFTGGWESFDSIEMGDPVAEGRSSSLSNLLNQYKMRLEELEATRGIKEKKLLDFAHELKQRRGQKNVFYFYQKEYVPMLNTMNLQRLYNLNEDKFNVQADLNDLMQMYSREKGISSDRLGQVFGDASVTFNLIFVDDARRQNISGGIVMQEQSEDVFESLSKAAKASGGLVEATKNAAPAFRKTLDMTESYYLLYYAPQNYKKDGKFRKIEVRLKNKDNKDYKVLCRHGYFG
jgi:VWFA-related protein